MIAMTYFSEDPTYPVGVLVLLAGAFFIALYVTQQGKYLVSGAVALGLALVLVMIEWLWVTDTERIEQVVYEIRNAVLKSDAEGVLAHMAPNVQYLHNETALSEALTRDLIRTNVGRVHFDFVRISNLQTSVAQQARRGNAEFRVFTRGTVGLSPGMADPGTAVTSWSLGFQETEPHVWKVNRISPVSIPREILALPTGSLPTDGSQIGINDGIGIPRSGDQPARRRSRIGMGGRTRFINSNSHEATD
jgi:hypothetical protein